MGSLWTKRQESLNQPSQSDRVSSQKKKHQNNQLFVYGNAVFSLTQNDYDEIERINQNNFLIFFQPDWSLQYREFLKGNWSQVFKRMTQSSVQILALFMSGSNNIIKQIQHIKFTNLEILSLGRNKIHSIEALAYLDMDTLKALRLNENLITSIQPLTKLKCNNLQILLLVNNRIVDLDQINRIKFNSAESATDFKSKLSVDLALSEQDKLGTGPMRVDVDFLMKIQLKPINQLLKNYGLIFPDHLHCLTRKNITAINII